MNLDEMCKELLNHVKKTYSYDYYLKKNHSCQIFEGNNIGDLYINISFKDKIYEDQYTLEQNEHKLKISLKDNKSYVNLEMLEVYVDRTTLEDDFDNSFVGFSYNLIIENNHVTSIKKERLRGANLNSHESDSNINPEIITFIFENINNLTDLKDLLKIKYDMKENYTLNTLIEELMYIENNILEKDLNLKPIL